MSRNKLSWLVALAFSVFVSSAASAQRLAQLPWWDRAAERNIGPYWIKSDLPADQVNALGRRLNVLWREYDKYLAHVPVRATDNLKVLVFKDRSEWAFTMRTRFAAGSAEQGGYFATPADRLLAFWTDGQSPENLDQLIQREAFRQFTANRFGDDLPVWLTEGMAELFSQSILFNDTLVFGQSTPRMLDEVQRAIRDESPIPFDVLFNINPADWANLTKAQPTMAHRQVRLMALSAMEFDGSGEVFAAYLKSLNAGLPANHAFSRAFSMTPAEFENRFKQYALTAKPGAFITAYQRIRFLAEGTLELSRRKMYPQSLNELRTNLREIGFAFTMPCDHERVEFSSADDALFEIPKDSSTSSDPVFVISKPRLAGSTKRDLELEKTNPTPPSIASQFLRPTGVEVKWRRDPDSNTFTYQILVR